MADDATTETTPDTPEDKTEEQHVPYERFSKVNSKAKEAAQRAAKLEQELNDLRTQLEEREQAGLPELERMKREQEKLAKRAEEAEKRAQEFEQQATNVRREQWVQAAAAALNFHEPDDASRFVDLSDIESREDAERAVKAIAKAKKHLVKSEDTKLPGKVLDKGQATDPQRPRGGINPDEEAETIGTALQDFLKYRQSASIGGL